MVYELVCSRVLFLTPSRNFSQVSGLFIIVFSISFFVEFQFLSPLSPVLTYSCLGIGTSFHLNLSERILITSLLALLFTICFKFSASIPSILLPSITKFPQSRIHFPGVTSPAESMISSYLGETFKMI